MPISPDRESTVRVTGALGLFALALGLLAIGHFIQFDDTSGTGSDQWAMSLAFPAGLAAVVALSISLGTERARLLLGGAIVALIIWLRWQQAINNDGFRFIWWNDEGELFLFEVVLGLVGLSLIATGIPGSEEVRNAPGGRWYVRAVGYLAATTMAAIVAFPLGVSYYDIYECAGSDGDCDLGVLDGILAVLGTILLAVPVIVGVEYRLRKRR